MKIRYVVLGLLCLVFSFDLFAQLNLIPLPKHIQTSDAYFELNENTLIYPANLNAFYVQELKQSIEQARNLLIVESTQKPEANFVEYVLLSDKQILSDFVPKGQKISDSNEAYALDISPNKISIYSMSEAGIFYGIQTLKQIIALNRENPQLPCLRIFDYPDFPVRGWQDDVSRGPIPTMELLKEQIRKMASFKLNYFTLYIEHVFKFDKHPGIAPFDGFTKQEINELTEYAKQYHVKLIGSYQSFGHMEETLKHPDYKHLAENEHIISPALSESYDFLSDVYSEIVPVFDGEYFNINCDETFGLGEGKSKAMLDSLGIDGLYLYHINRLNAMLEKYNKKILMWGDIVISYPQIIDKLPSDITVMTWAYHKSDSFDPHILPIKQTGLNFWVAPGVNCWQNIYPDMKATEINVYNFIRDAYKHNATGIINTSWDDDGLNLFHNNWHGFVWGAENSWNAPPSFETVEASNIERERCYRAFNLSFDKLFYGLHTIRLMPQILTFADLHENSVRDILKNTRFFEPIFPVYLEYVTPERKQQNEKLLRDIEEFYSVFQRVKEEHVHQNKKGLNTLSFAIRQVEFILRKNLLRIDLYHYLNGSDSLNVSQLKFRIGDLANEVQSLKKEYAFLWKQENRNSWLDVNLEKYEQLSRDIINLQGYCVISPDEEISKKGRGITIHSLFNDLPVYYALNDGEYQLYTKKFYIDENTRLKVYAANENKTFPEQEIELIYHKAIGKLLALNSTWSTYHPAYDGGGKNALLDGFQGEAEHLRSGKWQGFSGQDIEVEIDFEKRTKLNQFSMGFFQNTHDWVIFPPQVEIYYRQKTSQPYRLLTTIKGTVSPKVEGNLKETYTANLAGVKTRYVKVVAKTYGKLPEWHHAGSKYDSMLFADEIIIR